MDITYVHLYLSLNIWVCFLFGHIKLMQYLPLPLVLSGLTGDTKQARELFLQSIKLVKRKNNNLEKFCSRRVSYMHTCVHYAVTHTCI